MFKRKIYDRMLEWKKESDGRSPQKARDHYQSALICYRLNEMTDSYCSYVIQRISLCDARLRRSRSIDILIARIDQKIAELEAEEANHNTDNDDETTDDDYFEDDLNGNTLNIEELVERYKRANGSDSISENGSDTL